MTVYGWDISAHDWDRRKVSLANARRAGISLATHKATEGHTFADPHFADYARQNPGRFPVAGSYCAAWPSDSRQADHWYETVERTYPAWRDHACWIWQIDAEPWKNAPRAINPAEIDRLAKRIETLTGCPAAAIVVYAPQWHYGHALNGLGYRLWSSSYGANPAVAYRAAYPGDQGAGWDAYSGQEPVIWQYGSRTTIGRQHTCDANAIRVDSEIELQELFGGTMSLSSKDIDRVARRVLTMDGVLPSPPDAAKSNKFWSLNSYIRNIRAHVVAGRGETQDNGKLLAEALKRIAEQQQAVSDLTAEVEALKGQQASVKLEPTDVPVTGTVHIGDSK